MQSSECDERIESFASPPYFITLLNFKRECILHGTIFFTQVTANWMKKNLDITKPRSSEQILSVTLTLRYVEVPLY